MTALDEAACTLAKLHPRMWACSSCGWRSEQAIAAELGSVVRRFAEGEQSACPLCRRIGTHDPSCLEVLATQVAEGRQHTGSTTSHPRP